MSETQELFATIVKSDLTNEQIIHACLSLLSEEDIAELADISMGYASRIKKGTKQLTEQNKTALITYYHHVCDDAKMTQPQIQEEIKSLRILKNELMNEFEKIVKNNVQSRIESLYEARETAPETTTTTKQTPNTEFKPISLSDRLSNMQLKNTSAN